MQSKIIFNKIVLQNDMSDDEKILKIAEIRTKEEGDGGKFIPSSVTPGAIIGVTGIKNAVNNAFDEYILDIFDLKPVGEGYDRFYLAEYNSMIQSNSIG